MKKIKDENYFQISGWMINRLNLKGAMLLVYAIIYGFSQDGECEFKGSRQYLCDFIGVTKPTIDKALDDLCKKNFIIKVSETYNNVTFNKYKINKGMLDFTTSKEILPPSKETLQGGGKETLQGGKETLPNNNINNNIENNIENKKEVYKEKSPRFIPPTLDEIKKYCDERRNLVDVERFYDFYQSKGWMVGKNKMNDWKAAIRTWEREAGFKPTKTNDNGGFEALGDLEKQTTLEEDILMIKKSTPEVAKRLLDGMDSYNPERANQIRKALKEGQ